MRDTTVLLVTYTGHSNQALKKEKIPYVRPDVFKDCNAFSTVTLLQVRGVCSGITT